MTNANKMEVLSHSEIYSSNAAEISKLIDKFTLKNLSVKSILKLNLGIAYFTILVFLLLKLIYS